MKATTSPLIELKGVKLRFGEKTILDGVNLSAKKKDILVIMGLSGGGKSTLLTIILGLLEAQDGSVIFKDEDLTRLPRPKLNRARTHMGMVYQNAALVSSLNVWDNVALPLRELSDKKEDEIRSTVEAKLKQVDLAEAKDKLPDELSGGMKKRIGLARALVLDPELILFDEPSAGLDPINTKLIDDLIIELREKHQATSIVVTHEMESAFAIATRMAFLEKGKIILEGTPDEFRNSDNPTVSKFLASYSAHAESQGASHASAQK
jgi:phospholipid/cholesterol/gamma-HCH transport system ATP-binding protein